MKVLIQVDPYTKVYKEIPDGDAQVDSGYSDGGERVSDPERVREQPEPGRRVARTPRKRGK